MPTILKLFGFRFYFYSDEGSEPPHVHVEKGSSKGKYWLDPLREDDLSEFKATDRRKARQIIEEHQETFKNKWYEYFGK